MRSRSVLAALVAGALMTQPANVIQAQQPVKETHTYKTVDGLELLADVYSPGGEDVTPVVLWLHAGALIVGSRTWIFPDQLNAYLDAGYTVVAVDYRLAPQTKAHEIVEDVEDAYAWIRSEASGLRIDPDRIAVVGHSAGGYLTLMSGVRFSPKPAALVSFYGYGDIGADWVRLPDAYYNTEPHVSEEEARAAVAGGVVADAPEFDRLQFYLHTRQQGTWQREAVGTTSDEDPEAFRALSPLHNVTSEYPPTLLLHGDVDTDVPYEQSELMAAELDRHGVENDLVTMVGYGHVFDMIPDDAAVAAAFQRVLAFLEGAFGS